ncbi:hypothetical protein SynBIOSE41_03679 [Synechococcus sp. BIOS-E4-1]|uniref:hypothetical protein n=1 Tax=Synechococcus sp. BIOS-E4-1 TaxID=1400864 RepID=UPI001647AAA1|nr:hypothetical protein [Synechococcus sp. BIOS-E4-1]QNI56148.1 hypothetical protein SynBIOSE41_03679 [Synechococcus sp. BIOS-E4-1]
MDFNQLSGLVLVVVGAVFFVTAVQLYTFWASEAVLVSAKKRLDEKIETLKRSFPSFSLRRRKAA